MDAVKITELFKGQQLEEIQYWLDMQSPYIDEEMWEKRNSYYAKHTQELNTLHIFTTDLARDIFSEHNLLPSFSRIHWYEFSPKGEEHYDEGPVEHTIFYNYYSEEPVVFSHNGEKITLENNEAIAYCGKEFPHYRNESEGISICLVFNYASPSNPHFALGEYNGRGTYRFKSNKEEVEVDWL